LLFRHPDQLGRCRSLCGSVIILVFLRTHSIKCRCHHGTFPATHHARRVRPETPFNTQSLIEQHNEREDAERRYFSTASILGLAITNNPAHTFDEAVILPELAAA